MIAKLIVRFMNNFLNAIGLLIVVGGTIFGGYMANESGFNILLGLLIGFVASFLFMVLTCGVAFLALEINNNLVRIHKSIKK
jgi:hypothetical protein